MTYIDSLPTPPSRLDDKEGFSTKADALLGALPQFVTQANALSDEVDAMRDDTEAKRAATATLKSEAETNVGALKDAAEDARDLAMTYRDSANTYRGQAEAAKFQAQSAAAAAASGAGLPALAGNALRVLRVAEGETGVEFSSAANMVEITSSQTWTKPQANVFFVEIWAGGGGGANRTGASASDYASGAHGGEYSARLFDAADIPETVEITIGAGGLGAPSGSNTDGSGGGNTTFGTLLTAKGGVKGRDGETAGLGYANDGSVITTVQDDTTLERVWTIGASAGRGGYALGFTQYNAGQSVMAGGGGGGGCSPSRPGVGGISRNGGNGGDANATYNIKAGNGQFPSGGGGSSVWDGGGGNGAAGKVRITWW